MDELNHGPVGEAGVVLPNRGTGRRPVLRHWPLVAHLAPIAVAIDLERDAGGAGIAGADEIDGASGIVAPAEIYTRGKNGSIKAENILVEIDDVGMGNTASDLQPRV